MTARALPRLLSVVEAGGDDAREVGRRVYTRGTGAYTVGITGPPGAGKSTLTNRLIGLLRQRGSDVAVLAVDPSSPYTGGALLGDRVRMVDHAEDPGVFVRSMATRGHLGGLALAVPEVVRVLDAAGFGEILVETVGVGQSEVEVAGSADTTVVVLTPGAGDGVQANKAGLLEVADVFVINKADHPQTAELERDLRLHDGPDQLAGRLAARRSCGRSPCRGRGRPMSSTPSPAIACTSPIPGTSIGVGAAGPSPSCGAS